MRNTHDNPRRFGYAQHGVDAHNGHSHDGHGPRARRRHDGFGAEEEHHGRGHGGRRRGFGPRGRGFGPEGAEFPPGGPGFGPGFGPFGRGPRGARARKGDVRSAILSLLAEGPASGYGLMKSVADKTDNAWRPSPGSIYPTLAQLVDEQLIEPTDPNAARSDFRLTEAGTAYVEEHREEIDAAWNLAEADESAELRAATMKLIGALRQFGGTATAEQSKRASAKVDQLRRELYSILAE